IRCKSGSDLLLVRCSAFATSVPMEFRARSIGCFRYAFMLLRLNDAIETQPITIPLKDARTGAVRADTAGAPIACAT
ncbi:MAG: hypothetical protein ABI612_23315, partial [Betaproteobacteria bacterium]